MLHVPNQNSTAPMHLRKIWLSHALF